MTLSRHAKTSLLATMLLGCSTIAGAKETVPVPTIRASALQDGKVVARETIKQETSDILDLAAVDYCYAGSALDPVTGEMVDLYVVCAGDGVEQNLDLG